MLSTLDLTQRIPKETAKPELRTLKARLSALQQTVKEHKLPVIILFEGWSAAGKGSMISSLILTLDPRGFKTYSILPPDEAERRYPLLKRYWEKLPAYGSFSILDRSWYQDITTLAVEDKLSRQEVLRRTESIRIMERQLADDGTLILKFFLHISKKEQKDRLDKLEASKNTRWRVTSQDRRRNKHYDDYLDAYEAMLQNTTVSHAPWHIIPAHDKTTAQLMIFRTVVSSIESALAQKADQEKLVADPSAPINLSNPERLLPMPTLSQISLDKTLDPSEYDQRLKDAQQRLSQLHNKLYRQKVPLILAYEGWDAAGKGGNIKRVAAALDPRGYEVIPIAAPDKTELNHHYLWRFWRQLPKTGHIAIFDRTWYGRVMVERIEGFCTTRQWRAAYQEINEFEYELAQWGAVILKFWLHIDQDEQLRRFIDRQNTPEKQWKITEEDWRNREKWPQYQEAVDQMLQLTSTRYAPWYVIESQDKKYARIRTLELIIQTLEDVL